MNYILKKIEKKIYINNFFYLLIFKKKIFFLRNIFLKNFLLKKEFLNIIKNYLKENGFIK